MSQNKSFLNAKSESNNDEVHWLSVSDLMAGLMMVFLFISVALIRDAKKTTIDIEDLLNSYTNTQVALHEALHQEFDPDLDVWGAEINEKTLSFVFKSPDVLFDTGEITIKSGFKKILDDFFPRYLKVLKKFDISIDKGDQNKQNSFIQEVRIEGHTSSIWNHSTEPDKAYFNNMWLSQGRTRSVLQHVYSIGAVVNDKPWVKNHIAAVGFSSSKIIIDENNKEDKERSRRVEFRVITNAEQQLKNVIDRLKKK